MVNPEEVPKVYGFQNVLVMFTGLFSTIFYRLLYDATLRSFPGAFLLLSASLMLLSGVAYFALATQKTHIEKFTKEMHQRGKDGTDAAALVQRETTA